MNIILTGFMGTGKTEVGKKLAELLNYEFIDTDILIEKDQKISITEIFAKFGENYFRDTESKIVEAVSKLDKKIISTGGGVVLRKENMAQLRKNGKIVNLRAKPSAIYERLKDKKDRPLLQKPDVLSEINKLLDFRKKYYDDCDLKFDTDENAPSEIAEKIVKELKL